jgi:peptidoglycan hydrolase CwlO-like protein
MRKLLGLGLVVVLVAVAIGMAVPVRADECDIANINNLDEVAVSRCLDKLKGWVAAVTPAQEKNRADLAAMQKQVAGLAAQITALEKRIKDKQTAIAGQDKAFDEQLASLGEAVRSLYIREQSTPGMATVVMRGNLDKSVWLLGMYSAAARHDRDVIVGITQKLEDLRKEKDVLEKQQTQVAALKKQVAAKEAEFAKVVAEAEEAIGRLESQIATLTVRQQEILAAKTGLFTTSVGEVPPADDPAGRPDYNPGFSPAYAAFSFGAPHFKGMSQYGAFGRSKAGQSAEDILHAYYGGIEVKKDYSTGINITVQGHGTVDIETYVKRIYEMPGSWGDQGGFEALKAQAVAARSYALAYTNNGAGSICATESCQVYKPANKGGKWEEAVNATRGWVLMAGGRPFSAWYASTSGGYQESYTAGGYTTPGFWDTTCGGQGCWTSEAYEKKANSPWFYKGWYRTRSGASCGRSHPWLSREEFADIINALIVYTHDSGSLGHLSQTDAGGCWGGSVPDTWSRETTAAKAGGYGGPVSEVNGVSVTYATNGVTARVHVETDKGGFDFNGSDFKLIFNLRAPGAIHLTSGLFNIEKK